MKFKSPTDDFEQQVFRKNCITVNRRKNRRATLPLDNTEQILIACLLLGAIVFVGCIVLANFYIPTAVK